MAVLNAEELVDARRLAKKLLGTLDYDKATINAAVQAIEDWFETNRSGISEDIDTATCPAVMSNPEMKRLGAAWLLYKHFQEVL